MDVGCLPLFPSILFFNSGSIRKPETDCLNGLDCLARKPLPPDSSISALKHGSYRSTFAVHCFYMDAGNPNSDLLSDAASPTH